jgi:hypothetical protein
VSARIRGARPVNRAVPAVDVPRPLRLPHRRRGGTADWQRPGSRRRSRRRTREPSAFANCSAWPRFYSGVPQTAKADGIRPRQLRPLRGRAGIIRSPTSRPARTATRSAKVVADQRKVERRSGSIV